jgi:putative bacteriocin precursor
METYITLALLALAVGFVSAVLYNFICRKQVKKIKTVSITIEAPKCACGGNCACGNKKPKSKKVQPLLGVVVPKLEDSYGPIVAAPKKKKAVK